MTLIDKAEALRIVMEECYKDREMRLATRIEERIAALPARGLGVPADVKYYAIDVSEAYDTMMEVQRNPAGAWQVIQALAGHIAAITTTDDAQAREAALREAAAAVRARYMGDNNREDQEVLRCEAAILALIDKPASAAQAREAALHDRITEALVAAQERAHRAYEQDAPFDPNEHKVRISVKDTYAILALIGEPRP